tara:strand:+ start:995 stop:2290 length:1296 start_codon:yes stop_codon:yes gene_type:complete
MNHTTFQLLKTKRFLPLFITQFLGAMNDNLMKQALIVMITFGLTSKVFHDPGILVTIAAGIFILPFFLFSATAGQIADKFEKSKTIQLIKLAEIVIMIAAVIGFYYRNTYLLMTILFMMGCQSAFFGPLKYGILPNHLSKEELIAGNALIEGGTFLAILLGTIAGGLLIVIDQGLIIVSILLLLIATVGWLSSHQIPRAEAADIKIKLNPNILKETVWIFSIAKKRPPVLISILGISWFWAVGATFLTQFPNFTKSQIGGDATVVTLFMVTFSVGIAIGSGFCSKILKGSISAKFVPVSALGLAIFTFDLYFASKGLNPSNSNLIDAKEFIVDPYNWRILLDLTGISIFGGLYTVPLYAIIQSYSEPKLRSRTIAANNIINALFIVVGAMIVAIFLAIGWSIPQIFLALAIATTIVAAMIVKLPQSQINDP